MLAPVTPARQYVLVAVSSVSRAAAFQQVAADVLHQEVVLVRDGDDAMQEMARRGVPSLLIVDLSLPRVDGFAVVRKLRRDASDADTRVVVVAAHETLRAAARELSSSLGISSILALDVDKQALKEALSAESSAATRRAASDAPTTAQRLRGNHGSDADEVLERAAFDARRQFNLPISIGYLRIGENETLTFQASARGQDTLPPLGEIADFAFLRQVAEALDPLVVPLVENHPVFAPQFSKGAKPIRGFAAVPIPISRGDARAAMCLLDTRPVTLGAAEIDGLSSFGRSVGQELDRLVPVVPSEPSPPADNPIEDVKVLQHLASTDPLTGLANRRSGEKHIANEISRAKRERRPLSCILLDIDRFKQVNDTFGHQAGDQLLRDLSTLLRRTVRAYDILVRWGGEEFLIVLPGVDLGTAKMLAERVRLAVEALDTNGIGPVTISAGAATFETDYDFAMTLRAADQRLYQAKAAGRNRVT